MKRNIYASLMVLGAAAIVMGGCSAAGKAAAEEYAQTGSQEAIAGMDEELKDKEPDENEDSVNTSFLDERTGKSEYASLDEVKTSLQSGELYTELSILGMENAAAISQNIQPSETGEGVLECSIYGEVGGSVKCLGNIIASSSKYPIKLGDGYIYTGSKSEITQYACDKDTGEVIIIYDLSRDVDSVNTPFCIGFLRNENSLQDAGESIDTTDMSIYDTLQVDYNYAQVLQFTAVE